MARIMANPAVWIVRGDNATAYLFGSIHLLPTNVEWRTARVVAAMAESDTFVFEAPLDETGTLATSEFIREHGRLPDDLTLPSMLDAKTLEDYRKALAVTHVAPESLAHLRPWLAALILEVAFIRAEHYSPESGVDRQVFAIAKQEKRAIRYFETINRQLSLLMPQNSRLELSEFDTVLKEFESQPNEIGPLVDAWSHGDETRLGKLLNADLGGEPGAKKTLIDDRNKAWVGELTAMLAEHHTYFITVGAGHLAGPKGVPALLRARGFSVEGP